MYRCAGVLSVINAWGCDVECHIAQDDPLSRGQIRWIVFRLRKDPAYVFVEQQIPEVGRLLFQLPRLEKVILEWSMTEWTEERDPQAVPEGLDGEEPVEGDNSVKFERRREREKRRDKSGKRKSVKAKDWILKKKEVRR